MPNFDIPSSLGPYGVLEPIGQGLGGMGELFLCHDPSLDRKVVVKRVPEGAGEEALLRFDRETDLLSRVSHPGFPHVYRYWKLDGRPTMAMQFLDGLTLRELLDLRRALPLDVALLIALSVAEALRNAHGHEIVHRDVKPANIQVTYSGQVYLLDFGVARSESNTDLTIPGSVIGTTAYMAPEQARGEPVGPWTDIFSLGVVLYETVSGIHPFRKETPEATVSSILTDSPKSLWFAAPKSGYGLSRLVAECLQKKAAKRPQNCTQLLHRLDRLLVGKSRDREAYLAAFMAAVRQGKPFSLPLPRRGLPAWALLAIGAATALVLVLALHLLLAGGR